MRHSAIPASGAQTNSSIVQGGLGLARSNLRSRGLHELDPIGRNIQARVSLRPFLGILAERAGLIANKGPPLLRVTTAKSKQPADSSEKDYRSRVSIAWVGAVNISISSPYGQAPAHGLAVQLRHAAALPSSIAYSLCAMRMSR